jgi:hypothetical protein
MSNQAYGFKKDARFGKQHDVADIYNQFLDQPGHITRYPLPEPEKPGSEPKKPEPALPMFPLGCES